MVCRSTSLALSRHFPTHPSMHPMPWMSGSGDLALQGSGSLAGRGDAPHHPRVGAPPPLADPTMPSCARIDSHVCLFLPLARPGVHGKDRPSQLPHDHLMPHTTAPLGG
jgi:hypothetical protein